MSAGAKVLVVDDEPALARALAINLRAHGWEVVTAADGRSALDAAATTHPDVIVLDLGLPDMDGTEVIAGLRGWTSVPIVVLSARQHGEDKVEALDLGADDYVTKPFAMNELMARLRAAVRRAASAEPTETEVVVGDLVIDLARKRVRRDGTDVRLTPTEWAFLELLARNVGRLVPREQILREVWGTGYLHEHHYLRVYAAQLRRKLEDDPAQPAAPAHHVGARLHPRALIAAAQCRSSSPTAVRSRSTAGASSGSFRACDAIRSESASASTFSFSWAASSPRREEFSRSTRSSSDSTVRHGVQRGLPRLEVLPRRQADQPDHDDRQDRRRRTAPGSPRGRSPRRTSRTRCARRRAPGWLPPRCAPSTEPR